VHPSSGNVKPVTYHSETKITTFLSLLAACRVEPLLAKRIKETEPEEWVSILKFPENRLTVEEWGEMIYAARGIGDDEASRVEPITGNKVSLPDADDGKPERTQEVQLPPLVGLELITTWSDLGVVVGPSKESKTDPIPFTGPVQILDSLDDTSSQDPLRHRRLHYQPLRDADPADQSLWAELLLDLGFHESDCKSGYEPSHKSSDALPRGPCRRRRRFLDTWRPPKWRLASTKFEVRFGRETLEAFFVDNASVISRSTLYWLHRPDPQDSGTNPQDSPDTDPQGLLVRIGWLPLMEGLRGVRDPLSMELLGDLLIDPSSVKDEKKSGDGPRIGPLLPSKLSALVLLIDGLYRCPWSAFSTPLNRQVATYLGLAAAFVRTSYVYALYQSGQLKEESYPMYKGHSSRACAGGIPFICWDGRKRQ